MLLFLIDLINIEKFIISFRFFYSLSFILRSRATSVWYQSITSIRDQVIIFVLHQFGYCVCGVPFTCNLPEFSSTCSLKPSEGDPSESLLQRKENRFNGRDLVNMFAD